MPPSGLPSCGNPARAVNKLIPAKEVREHGSGRAGKCSRCSYLRLKQGFSADRGTESLENEDLEEAVRYGVLFYGSNPSGKNRAGGDFPIVI